jgi:hypothetical protein
MYFVSRSLEIKFGIHYVKDQNDSKTYMFAIWENFIQTIKNVFDDYVYYVICH